MAYPVHLAERETDRLYLRAPTAADLAAVFEIYGDPATHRYNPAGPLTSRDAAGHMLWRWQLHWAQHGFGMWVVCKRGEPETVLGFGGLSWRPYGGVERLNLGFRLRTATWGQGIASELGRAALDLAFGQLEESAVYALVRPENTPSRKVLAKLGLQEVDSLSDLPWLPASLVCCIHPEAQQLVPGKPQGRLNSGLSTPVSRVGRHTATRSKQRVIQMACFDS
ncbi:GNAT family N-acetyltransferase [Chitinimonas sp. BJB300]|uniref:GNAT family N-acetyltransferase n=1 Tax=Chitinimonas sp. BJB300 TaxID=1559339 RepID=UPI000C0FECDC|nr:GNAT family N-acetyltransferase [Chitinimonas sp. BJB300]PHV11947.1 GNAT family N-acetyltransferase [Chitinimonas sp. BJB300]TSJ87289.1 GNAT family N-acetyltransferase [Chitinimonas sp. BJB300]